MGLRYLSSDSSGMKSNLKKSLQQGKQVVQELKSGSQQLISAVDGHTLSGAAYTAGKGLFSELIIPTINRVSSALEDVEQDLHKYESQEHIVSGEALLDEDSLMQERQIKRSLAESARSMSNMYAGFAKSIEHVPVLEMGAGMFKSHAKQMENVARSYQDEVKKIEEKIKKLHQFSSGTQSLFGSSLSNLKIAMQAVTTLNEMVVNSHDGSYSFPIGKDKSWFTKQKGLQESAYQRLQSALNIEDGVLSRIGLTKKQRHEYSLFKKILQANPGKAIEVLYKSDVLWAVVAKLAVPFPKLPSKFLDGLVILEKAGNTEAGLALKKGVDYFGKFTSPIKTFGDMLGVTEKLGNTKIFQSLGKGPGVVEFVGKAGTVTTFASIAANGLYSGITDGIKTKSIGKGVIGGSIGAVKGIGPLEGMTIGATIGASGAGIGALPGAIIGVVVGTGNTVVQIAKPDLYSDLSKEANSSYDKFKNDWSTMGNGIESFIKDPIKTWNAGAEFRDKLATFVDIPKIPKIQFGVLNSGN
ncbi:hypothetical protein ESZ50_07380 [Weissella muntiaci]|uniref:LXG domain-containing protein n=1 Tax=Weissella muntiaci TaxID=2508881 RepID=A0A6C2C5S7_9LACO|nr:T7SS effector LXG polymorphic toxin [Weissella muntiaci]TYC49059.1 hypothetical protein ESZ50_07380 [Weissella muntiaci]